MTGTSTSPRPPITTRPARADERPVVADVLARAFIDDPAMSWLFPDRADRARRLARFFALSARLDADPGLWSLALDASGSVAAATMWRPPGQWKTPFSAMVLHLVPLVRAFGTTLPRALSLQSMLEAHHPHTPHWYLQYAGCVPELQGRGLGGAAIRAQLAQCDAATLPAALETATPGNVGLYQSVGFAVTDEFDIPDGPHFWSMWRAPRPAV
jgi:ribosomal protein S18 acetylase RimI-like enzyme